MGQIGWTVSGMNVWGDIVNSCGHCRLGKAGEFGIHELGKENKWSEIANNGGWMMSKVWCAAHQCLYTNHVDLRTTLTSPISRGLYINIPKSIVPRLYIPLGALTSIHNCRARFPLDTLHYWAPHWTMYLVTHPTEQYIALQAYNAPHPDSTLATHSPHAEISLNDPPTTKSRITSGDSIRKSWLFNYLYRWLGLKINSICILKPRPYSVCSFEKANAEVSK